MEIHDPIHVSSSKSFHDRDSKALHKTRKLPAESAKGPDYNMSRILDHNFKFGTYFSSYDFEGYSRVCDSI